MMNNLLISLGSTFLVSKEPSSLKVPVKAMPPAWWVVVDFFFPQLNSICRL